MRLDFDKIRAENPLPEIIARSGVDLRKNGAEYSGCCPFHPDKSPSFTVFHGKTGWNYMCFGCGASGDVIDFAREHYGFKDAGEAGRWLLGDAGDATARPTQRVSVPADPYAGYSVIKPPAGAPALLAGQKTPLILNPKRGKSVTYTPSMVFPYTNRRGELLGYVIRVEFSDKKITPGVWWMRGNGFEGWAHGSYPSPRPLYGLEGLYANPDWQALLVEGEKCADAANRVMRAAGRKVVAVSWMGGGKATARTYWKSLEGRSVVIWPDADEEGAKTARELVKHCKSAGARQIKVIDVSGQSGGWDIADAEAEWTPAQICEFIKERVRDGQEQRSEKDNSRGCSQGDVRNVPSETSTHQPTKLRDSDSNTGGSSRLPSRPGKREGLSDDIRGLGASEDLPQRADSGAAAERGSERDDTGKHIERDSRDKKERHGEEDGPVEPVNRHQAITHSNWRDHLIMNEKGEGLKSTSGQNAALILQYEKNFADLFAWDDFAHNVLLMRRPIWDVNPESRFPRHLKDSDTTACCGWLEYAGLSVKFNDVGRIIVRVAEHNKFNPVKDALNNLEWDGKSRINGHEDGLPFFAEYFGAEDTEINRLFGEKWLIGAVARAMQPGCKMDTMIVLEGPQGLRKSTSLQVLSDGLVKGVFTDEMSDPNSKDAALQMQGRWIIEIAELDSFSKATVTGIKSWLARSTDRFRRPYGKVVEEFPRSCVMAGTVNPLGNSGYLKDPTGGRRFWPVETTYIDIDRLEIDAKQIWAEALHLYKQGVKWWLSQAQDALATEAQKRRYEDDPWSERIDGYCSGHSTVSLQAIMTNCLEIPAERQSILVTRRISSHMVRRGWGRVEENGKILYQRKGE